MQRFPIILLTLLALSAAPLPAQVKGLAVPAPQTPAEVIAIINDYRAQNGLPVYQVNNILMQIAQGQADYLASIVQTNDVHAGPGGSRPRDRAYAAGYAGGSQFFLSEIGVYGLGMTPDNAVNWWKGSPDHNPTLIASTYVEFGCGVSTDGNGRYYYICDMGYVAGGSYMPSNSGSQPQSGPVMIPVVKADPRPDGSVVHIIRQGQTLWTLAAVYEVPLQQILELNHFSESQIIHPGDEVIIMPPGSVPTLTPTVDESQPSPTLTEEPTRASQATNTAVIESSPTPPSTQEPLFVRASPAEIQKTSQQNASVKLVVGVSLVGILAVFAASFLIQKPRPPQPPEENDPFAPIK